MVLDAGDLQAHLEFLTISLTQLCNFGAGFTNTKVDEEKAKATSKQSNILLAWNSASCHFSGAQKGLVGAWNLRLLLLFQVWTAPEAVR